VIFGPLKVSERTRSHTPSGLSFKKVPDLVDCGLRGLVRYEEHFSHPPIRNLSLTSTRWGDVNIPVLLPEWRRMLSAKAQVDPCKTQRSISILAILESTSSLLQALEVKMATLLEQWPPKREKVCKLAGLEMEITRPSRLKTILSTFDCLANHTLSKTAMQMHIPVDK
jgi:hypothetical protein